MTATKTQKQIIQFAHANGGQITKREAVDLFSHRYFINESHYVGEILSRMVNAGMLTRIKPGVFELGGKVQKSGSVETAKNQLTLEL